MTNIFVTGVTGYIAGDALVDIVNSHPDWNITCLVRSKEKGAQVTAAFPQVKLVYGDLDDLELIEEEASLADIVYHFANNDHVPSARAIAAGLARRKSDGYGYWIHTSGTGILTWKTIREGSFGEDQEKVYDDWDGIDELTSLPDDAVHRPVDKVVLAASAEHPDKIRTAIVGPPTIYGAGRGPGNTRSVQLNLATKTFLEQKEAFSVDNGQNVWHSIYVQDLSKLYLLLGEAAVAGGRPATWNDQGYYFAENGQFVWGDVFRAIAQEAHKRGLLPSAEVGTKTKDEVSKYHPGYAFKLGSTSRGVSKRANALLDWKPTGLSMFELIPELVESEAKSLGLRSGSK